MSSSTDQERTFMGCRQAAEVLGVIPRRVRYLCERGELRATMAGGLWIINRRDLADYQRRRPAKPKPDPDRQPAPTTCPTCGGDAETSPYGRDGRCPDDWHAALRPTQPKPEGGNR